MSLPLASGAAQDTVTVATAALVVRFRAARKFDVVGAAGAEGRTEGISVSADAGLPGLSPSELVATTVNWYTTPGASPNGSTKSCG